MENNAKKSSCPPTCLTWITRIFCMTIFIILLQAKKSTTTPQSQAQIAGGVNLKCYRSTNLTSSPCQNLTSKICMGTSLPFSSTSISLVNDSLTLEDVYKKLKLWSGLRNVPQCWAVVQPFLCSVYLPKCDDVFGIELPSKEVCERTRKPCQIVQEINNGWPDFLRCDHPNFVSGCGQETYDKLTFNTTGKCESPLVRTDNPGSWYNDVDGCGVPCDNPLFTPEQHREVHTFVAVFGSICLACTLFTVLTFIIDWNNAKRYPALILFFINACFFLGSIGWMSQFVGDARRDIVCRKDGTVRKGEPKANESISCTVVFIIVYYFLVAGVSWFVMLAYAWYLTFTALGTPRDALKSKTAYFHLISWCLPLVLTIICLAISEVDGDSVSGICFVGGFNHSMRALFVLLPVGLVIVVGTFFLLRGVCTLIRIKKEAPVFIPEKTFSKIRDTIVRLGIFTTVALIFVFITFSVHVYIFSNEDRWKESFKDYMYCIANVSVTEIHSETQSVCTITDRPSLVAMEIHIFAFFGAGIAMSSWSWTKASLSAWERFFRWIFHKPSNKPVKLKRHRMIAQAFQKRKEINQGRVSISYRSSHDDPLGMKFDLNSGSDDELSSNFAMAMPKLVCRRGGLIFPIAGMGRRYSDSDVQSVISTRRVSRESLMSFRERQFYIIQSDDLPIRRGKKKKKKKRGKLNRLKPAMGNMFSGFRFGSGRFGKPRKGSDSSALSQMSGRSVQISMERNSIETVSLQSNMPPDRVLPAVTKRDEKVSGVKSSRVMPVSDLSPSKRETDFSIFSAKDSGTGTASLPGELVESHSHILENNPSLPGALEEEVAPDLRSEASSMLQSCSSAPTLKRSRTQTPNSKGLSPSLQKPESKTQTARPSATSSVSKSKHKTQTLTVKTQHVEEGNIPLHSLMADISGGNWGVLLGKSGSSSGSDAGGGASAYIGGLNPYMSSGYPPLPVYGHNPYMAYPSYQYGATPYMGVPSMQMGGARPKAKGQWGHFPYFPSNQQVQYNNYGGKNQERRMMRERQREREMRRPNQAYFNNTFQIDDADIEYISS
ncbi:smoothened homolog [Biomphalaria glabrata]|uniref:Protein smoothened n=1 Tax=Biomphalaria glabrata TaxID=6526 RepID=A0A9U8EE50_BIOGL|nr:smoothened homolog [Biomphalaria glabrata]XP_055871799.1 smoothened homolog [Biomphalaria glabrata]